MNIAHFASFGIGGADKNAYNILLGLKQLGCNPVVLWNDNSVPRYMSGNHNSNYNPLSRKEQFEKEFSTKKISSLKEIDDLGIDILHTHRSGEDTWLIPGFDSAKHPPYKILETNFHGNRLTKADIRAYPAQSLCSFKNIKMDASNIIIPNAIMKKRHDRNLRDRPEIGQRFICGRIARPDADIYCDVNLKAYKLIESDDTMFIYVAPHDNAKRDAAKLGIKNIMFLPPVLDEDEICALYNTFDVLLHSNQIGETFGNTVAEAMMHGKPVVSHTGIGTWPQAHLDLFGTMQNLVVKGQDHAKYAENIRFLMNRVKYEKASLYLQSNVESKYSCDIIAGRYLKLYKEIMETK